MFRRGERGCAYEDPSTGEFHAVIVLAGFFDVVRSDVLAVLRRRTDGQRVLLTRALEFVEVPG
jgi:hypothetical protein